MRPLGPDSWAGTTYGVWSPDDEEAAPPGERGGSRRKELWEMLQHPNLIIPVYRYSVNRNFVRARMGDEKLLPLCLQAGRNVIKSGPVQLSADLFVWLISKVYKSIFHRNISLERPPKYLHFVSF